MSQAMDAYKVWPAVGEGKTSMTPARLHIDNAGQRHGGSCIIADSRRMIRWEKRSCALRLKCVCVQLRVALEGLRQEGEAAAEELRRQQEASRAQFQALQTSLTDAQVPAFSSSWRRVRECVWMPLGTRVP